MKTCYADVKRARRSWKEGASQPTTLGGGTLAGDIDPYIRSVVPDIHPCAHPSLQHPADPYSPHIPDIPDIGTSLQHPANPYLLHTSLHPYIPTYIPTSRRLHPGHPRAHPCKIPHIPATSRTSSTTDIPRVPPPDSLSFYAIATIELTTYVRPVLLPKDRLERSSTASKVFY